MTVPAPVVAPIDETLAASAPLERSNILIVDDRLDKRVVFRTILEELDQNIVTASSGEEALRWLLDNDCAVILLDVNMPGMDGLETAELIRARRKSAHTPIIFITAFADEMHTARGYSLGAVDYILSPVVPNILRSKVKALVQLQAGAASGEHAHAERLGAAAEGDAVDDCPAGEVRAFPLVTRGKTRGALLVALGPSTRRLTGPALSLADSLAGRAAASLDNCL